MTRRAREAERMSGLMVGALFVTALAGAQPRIGAVPALERVGDRDVGTRAPGVLAAMAADGRWVVVCEAREDTDGDGRIAVHSGYHGETYGDLLQPFFVMGEGAGEPIDDLVDADPRGRWVVWMRNGRMILRDTTTGREEDLTARGARLGTEPSGAAGFDVTGERLHYLRHEGAGSVVVVRELSSGRETMIRVPRGIVDRVVLAGDGRWVSVAVLEDDTNGDGALTPMRLQTSLSEGLCRGPASIGSTSGTTGDEPVVRVARLGRDTSVRAVPGRYVVALGARILVRASDGSLAVVDGQGRSRTWVPRECGGVVLAVATTGDRVLVGCGAVDDLAAPLELVSDAGRHALGVTGRTRGRDQGYPRVREVAWVRQGADEYEGPSVAVDFRTARVRQFRTGEEEEWRVARHGYGEIFLRERRAWARDLRTGAERALVRGQEELFECGTAGRYALCGSLLIDVREGRVLGRAIGTPEAVTSDGRVLVRRARRARDEAELEMAPGTFHWMRFVGPDADDVDRREERTR